ncbi:MAG: sialidase family protein [Thermoplasmatota archaeon]
MHWLAPGAFALLLAAGCLQTPPSASPAPALQSLSVTWSTLPFTGTETKLAVSSSGVLFYAGARADPNAPVDGMVSTLHRSRDGGATWQEVTPRLPTGDTAPPSGSVDPITTVDPDTGRVFFASMFPRDVCGFVSWSDTEGDTWMHSPFLCGTHPPFDHPFIVTSHPRVLRPVGYPNLVHVCVNQVGDTQCLRSLDGGLTWSPGTPPFAGLDPSSDGGLDGFPQGFCGGLEGPVVAAPDGTLYVPRQYCERPYLAVSRDDGTTWSTLRVSPKSALEGPDPALAVDREGNLYYAWADILGTAWLTTSRDGGSAWSDAARVSPEGVTAQLPTVAAGGPGQVVVGFLGTRDLPRGFLETDFDLYEDDRPLDGTVMRAAWHAWVAASSDAFSGQPFNATLASDPAQPLVRGHCDARYCPGPFSDYNGAVVAPSGRAFLTFVDWCPGDCATADGVRNREPGAASLAALSPWGP